MIVACGPFTSDSDISYRPWRALLQQIKVAKPDVLMLVRIFFPCLTFVSQFLFVT
jgi:DNA polymerase alpha subunit B